MKYFQLLTSIAALTALLFLAACRNDSEIENAMVPRLLIETRGVNYGGTGADLVTLPVSGTTIPVQNEPLVTEFDIINVEMVQVDLGRALVLQLSPEGTRRLYRGSVANMGQRIVLSVNGNAIGARRIDGAIQDGNVYTFVEVDDEELGQLVIDMKETIVEIQEKK